MEKSSKSTRLRIFSTGCLLLAFLLIANILVGNCTVSIESSPSWEDYRGNSTTTTIADHDQEFLMQSQFGDLLATNCQSFTGRSAGGNKGICPGPSYKNCIQKCGYPTKRRPCDLKNFCDRAHPP